MQSMMQKVTEVKMFVPQDGIFLTDAEWTILTEYLTTNGYGYEGSGTDISQISVRHFWLANIWNRRHGRQ